MKLLLLFLTLLSVSNGFLPKNFLDRTSIACKYNRKKIIRIIDIKKNELDLKLSKKVISDISENTSDELIDILNENTKAIIEINSEYLYFLALITSELFKFSLNEINRSKTKEEWVRVILKNFVIPLIIHDFIRLISDFIKYSFSYISQ